MHDVDCYCLSYVKLVLHTKIRSRESADENAVAQKLWHGSKSQQDSKKDRKRFLNWIIVKMIMVAMAILLVGFVRFKGATMKIRGYHSTESMMATNSKDGSAN